MVRTRETTGPPAEGTNTTKRGGSKLGRVERWIWLCQRKDGELYYRLDFYTADRRRVREPAGSTLTDARKLRAKREAEIHAGTYEHPKDREKRETAERKKAAHEVGPTFAEFADRFLREYGSQWRSSYYDTASAPLVRYFGPPRLREITSGDMDAYRLHCLKIDEVGPSTTRKRLTVLGTLFKCAKRWGVVDANPATDLEKPSEPGTARGT